MAAYAEDDKEIEELEACMDELRSAYEADKSSQHEVDEALRLSMKLADKRGSALRHAETLIGSVDLNAVAELKSKLSRAEAALEDARLSSLSVSMGCRTGLVKPMLKPKLIGAAATPMAAR